MRVLCWFALATLLLTIVVGCRRAELPDFVTAGEKNAMETVRCIPAMGKAGVGIVHDPLYVVTNSTRNDLIIGHGEEWIGRKASTPEVVVYYDGKVWPLQSLPNGFDKSKSVVILFEENNVRVYDYIDHGGCYFERYPTEERQAP